MCKQKFVYELCANILYHHHLYHSYIFSLCLKNANGVSEKLANVYYEYIYIYRYIISYNIYIVHLFCVFLKACPTAPCLDSVCVEYTT